SEMIEIPPETAARALVAVDSRDACRAEAGEIIRAAERGLVSWSNISEIGEILLGQKPSRTSPEQITFFKSVGVAVQDAVAAQLALENARKMGVGQRVHW
ncbi:MAG: ornithine cyclodeaminase, partial [Anaerolineales bacterium]